MLWFLTLIAFAESPAKVPKEPSPWVFSLMLRGWQANAGQLTQSGLGLEAKAVSPELLLLARRGPLVGRILYQNETSFEGLRNGLTPQRMHRQDNEWGLGYFHVPANHPFTFKLWAGYKLMEILREDVRADSENIWRYRGWQVANTSTYEGELFQRFVDVSLTLGYAILDTNVDQRNTSEERSTQELIQVDPYGYQTQGFFGDAVILVQLRPRVKWFFGYKRQVYRPTRSEIETTIRIPNLEPRQTPIATNRFSSDGWLMGFKIEF